MSVGFSCVVYSKPSHFNQIMLDISIKLKKLFLSFELVRVSSPGYPKRCDLRFTLRFETEIFTSVLKYVSTCQINLLFFCLRINHESLFCGKVFYIVTQIITVQDHT